MTAGWVAAAAAVAGVVLAAVTYAGRLTWQLLRGTWQIIGDWQTMKDAIADLQAEVADVKAETKPNDGHSMRDDIMQMHQTVQEIQAEQAAVRAALTAQEGRDA